MRWFFIFSMKAKKIIQSCASYCFMKYWSSHGANSSIQKRCARTLSLHKLADHTKPAKLGWPFMTNRCWRHWCANKTLNKPVKTTWSFKSHEGPSKTNCKSMTTPFPWGIVTGRCDDLKALPVHWLIQDGLWSSRRLRHGRQTKSHSYRDCSWQVFNTWIYSVPQGQIDKLSFLSKSRRFKFSWFCPEIAKHLCTQSAISRKTWRNGALVSGIQVRISWLQGSNHCSTISARWCVCLATTSTWESNKRRLLEFLFCSKQANRANLYQ